MNNKIDIFSCDNNHRIRLLEEVIKIKPKIAVEVGVLNGEHGQLILNMCSTLEELNLIDCWDIREEDESPQNYQIYIKTGYFDTMYKRVCEKFEDETKVKIIKDYSVSASKKFEDETIDFVYVDACHKYTCVIDDITNWFPKIKSGGYIGGDDYCVQEELGVVKAVDDCINNFGYDEIDNVKLWKGTNHGSWLMRKL
jgi:hypothetical protein